MAIGYACICIGDINRYRSLRLRDASYEKLTEIYSHNLEVLESNIKYNIENGIKLFRISSDIFPLITHEDVKYEWQKVFSEKLDHIKKLTKESGMRVSMHPGQYTVLNSISSDVAMKAVAEIEYHSLFLSMLTEDEYAPVIIHAGSGAGGKKEAAKRFAANFKKLSADSRKRLCLEKR